MIGCPECFDLEIPAQLLAERCRRVSANYCPGQPGRILIRLTCTHGITRNHTVYRWAHDWAWANRLLLETSDIYLAA